MPDYRQPLRFGLFPSPAAVELPEAMAVVDVAEQTDIDLVGIQDHPYQAQFLDTWALMATVLDRTSRVHVFPDVASLPLRPPAVLAKAAASLDLLSDGRFELGLGAGAFWPAITAMGGPDRTPREAGEALGEAVDVITLMWSGERSVRYDGRHYRMAGVHPGPRPAHRIGIWLGVGGPKMLALAGRKADGWIASNSYFPPNVVPDMQQRIDAAATAAGREPTAVRRIYNVFGSITDGASRGDFEGPVDQWVDTLTELALDAGLDTFVFGPADDAVTQSRRFAEQVAPRVRSQVDGARGSAT